MPGQTVPLLMCQHLNFAIHADVNRHTAGEGGPVFSFTVDITLKCTECDLAFHFGAQPRLDNDGRTLRLQVGPGPVANSDYVPGEYRCPTCLFRLTSHKLYTATGTTGPNDDAPEPCPNDGTALEQLTWKESADEAHESAHQIMARCLRAESRISDLETAWPADHAMPAELLEKYDPFAELSA